MSQKGFAHLLVLLILFLGLLSGLYLVQHPQVFKPRAQENPISSYNKILEVALLYDESLSPSVQISKVEVKNGFAPKYFPENQGYTLQVLDTGNNLIQSLIFNVPNKIPDPPPLDPSQQSSEVILKKINFVITLPFSSSAANVQVISPEGAVIDSRIIEAAVTNNQISAGMAADRASGKLNIAFISEGYSDMNQFHSDVDKFKANLLTYEPFKSRASQIQFNNIDNSDDLGCYRWPGMDRLLVCDNGKVLEKVNNSGTPYDQVAVIVNDSNYGGSGGSGVPVAYNGEWGAQIFVHELGHSLGNLYDEYVLYSGGDANNLLNRNCYESSPSTEVWPDTDTSQYRKECKYENWYRSSPTSIMRDITIRFFNPASMALLNERLDYFAGPAPTPTPSPSVISIPTPTVCRSVDCEPPKGCYFTGPHLYTSCDPNVAPTCGSRVCPSPTPTPKSN